MEFKMSLESFKKRRAVLQKRTDAIFSNMDKIAEESLRVANVAHNSEMHLNEIEEEFEKQTGLNSTDIKFLFFATSLQTARWILLALVNRYMSKKKDKLRVKHDESSIKKMEKELSEEYQNNHKNWVNKGSKKYPTWIDIVTKGVPYDVSVGSTAFGENMLGGCHRVRTLGHDPVLGWIFGVMNIISSTITIDNFRTFEVSIAPPPKRWSAETNLLNGFAMTYDSINEDINRLPAAVFAQAVHLKSDIFTKMGLPVPLLEIFSQELAGNLYKSYYDLLCLSKDVAIVGSQAFFSILINMIISLIHGLYFDPLKYDSRDVYEVKTRKILLYSNIIATSSNLIWTGVNLENGNEDAIKDLDIGGLLITIYRLISDVEFILKIKEEFVLGGFFNLVKGEDLELVKLEDM